MVRYLYRHILLTLMVAILAWSFLLGTLSPAHARDREPVSPELESKYFTGAIRLKDRLLQDYRSVVSVYYELKTKSATPNSFPNPRSTSDAPGTNAHLYEFSLAAYDEFKDELEKDPRLRGNSYVRRMKEYGQGQANDVFQRIATYAQEPFQELPRGVLSTLSMESGNGVMALGMLDAHEVFLEESKKAGYPQNGRQGAPADRTEWAEMVKNKSLELEKEIRELGYDPETLLTGNKTAPSSRKSTTRRARHTKASFNRSLSGRAESCATYFRPILESY